MLMGDTESSTIIKVTKAVKKKSQHSWLQVAIRTSKYDSLLLLAFSWPAAKATSAHHMGKVEANEDSNVPDRAPLN